MVDGLKCVDSIISFQSLGPENSGSAHDEGIIQCSRSLLCRLRHKYPYSCFETKKVFIYPREILSFYKKYNLFDVILL